MARQKASTRGPCIPLVSTIHSGFQTGIAVTAVVELSAAKSRDLPLGEIRGPRPIEFAARGVFHLRIEIEPDDEVRSFHHRW